MAWFEQELGLPGFLAAAGAPVVPPSEEVGPEPVERRGLLVTFWKHVDHDPARFDPEAAGRSLRALHRALAAYEEPLPSFDRLDEIDRLLRLLRPSTIASADDLSALRRAWQRLEPPPPGGRRPLNGDSHFNNVLWTEEGPLWTDLENACEGPVEYDVACLLWRDAPGTNRAVAAYGRYDREVAASVEPFLSLFLAVWTIAVIERVPSAGGRAELRRRIDRATAAVRRG
ncbi:MAG TPA: phosphotransferase [Gaiellaceae bacterium]|nr:phosphotransferase [Gaiellaceae bacterium]